MASIDFISCNAEHSKMGPMDAERATNLLFKEKSYAELRGKKTKMWASGKETILEIDESETGCRMTRHVVVNYSDNSTYARI